MKKSSQSQSSTTTNPYAIGVLQGAQSSLPTSYTPLTGQQIQQYQNPFTQSVIDTTLARTNQDEGQALNEVRDQATRAGAFGGSRQGVAEALTRGQFDLNRKQLVAGLNAEGYDTALQTAQQEHAQQYQYPLAIQALLGQLAQGTQQNSWGKSSGTQTGFGWSSKNGFTLG
jgi:hypothetical protein